MTSNKADELDLVRSQMIYCGCSECQSALDQIKKAEAVISQAKEAISAWSLFGVFGRRKFGEGYDGAKEVDEEMYKLADLLHVLDPEFLKDEDGAACTQS